MAPFPGFIGPAYRTANRSATSERLVNLYPEKNESPGAKVPWVLNPIPGFTSFATTPFPSRGIFAQDGRCVAVNGDQFYDVPLAGGTLTSKGSVAMGSQRTVFAMSTDASQQLLVGSGRSAYIYDLSTNLLSAAVKTGVDFVGYLDGYFLALDAQLSTLYISDLFDGTAWTIPGAQRDGAGDRWVSMLVTHQDIWLFGSETSEVWANLGGGVFPFAIQSGAILQHGTCAPQSVALLRNSPVWLSQSSQGAGVVLKANGYGDPQRISNHAIEQAIQSYPVISDAEATTEEYGGHAFYVLTFPTANVTWVYDDATDSWHQRASLNPATGEEEAYRPNCHAYAFGKHLVGDRASGVIYELDFGVFTDVAGKPMRASRRSPYLGNSRFVFDVAISDPVPRRFTGADVTVREGFRRMFVDRFVLDMEVGIGLRTGQGSDPEVMLRVSTDGGYTFGNELTRSAGERGEYRTIVAWNRCGSAQMVA